MLPELNMFIKECYNNTKPYKPPPSQVSYRNLLTMTATIRIIRTVIIATVIILFVAILNILVRVATLDWTF